MGLMCVDVDDETLVFLLRIAPRPNNALKRSGLLWAEEMLVFYSGLRHTQTMP
jgi:hypothetical protein